MKKIKRSAVLIIAFCFAAAAFAGCTESGSSESANHEKTYEQIAASLTFIDEMPETDLPRPEREIGSREEFIDALDYLSFYRVNEEVSLKSARSTLLLSITPIRNLVSYAKFLNYPISIRYFYPMNIMQSIVFCPWISVSAILRTTRRPSCPIPSRSFIRSIIRRT